MDLLTFLTRKEAIGAQTLTPNRKRSNLPVLEMAFSGYAASQADSEPQNMGPVLPHAPGAAGSGAMTKFFELGKTSGIPLKVRTAFAAALEVEVDDDETLAVNVGSMDEAEITAYIADLATEDGPINGLGRGQAWRWYRSAKLIVHQVGLGPVQPTAVQEPPQAPQAVIAKIPEPPATKRCNEVLDQANDGVFPILSLEEVGRLRARYETVCGLAPDDSCRPTADQLAGLAHLLKKGRAPYVDLSLFGPSESGPRDSASSRLRFG